MVPGVAVLVAAHLGLLLVADLAARPLRSAVLLAAAFASLAWVSKRVASRGTLLSLSIIPVALILRLTLLPLAPTLSDDWMRYLWDGRVLGAGFNPWVLEPDAAALTDLRDAAWTRMPHRDVATVYPPVAMGVFTAVAWLPWPLTALKLMLVAADLTTCGLLLVIAGRSGISPTRAIWYAWNPLVVLEVAGMGHVDALGIAACAAVVALLLRGRRVAWSGVAAASAVLAKLVPVLALPLWARHSGRPRVFLAAAFLPLLALLLPIAVASGGIPSGIVRMGISWEFNGPLFEPLWRGLAALDVPSGVEVALDQARRLTGWQALWNRLYPLNYPQFLAKVLLAGLLVALLMRAWRGGLIDGTGRVFGSLVLCSATVYPWYLLWVLPWAALARQRAWRLLAGLSILAYAPATLGIELFPWIWLAIWLPFLVLLVRDSKWSIDSESPM